MEMKRYQESKNYLIYSQTNRYLKSLTLERKLGLRNLAYRIGSVVFLSNGTPSSDQRIKHANIRKEILFVYIKTKLSARVILDNPQEFLKGVETRFWHFFKECHIDYIFETCTWSLVKRWNYIHTIIHRFWLTNNESKEWYLHPLFSYQ